LRSEYNVLGPLVGKSCHQLVEELLLLLRSDLGHSGAHVERVIAERLVVGSQIEGEGQSAVGVDTGASSVQGQLADRNTHAVDTKVTKTENTRTVSEDGDVDLVGPVVKNLAEIAPIVPREVHALGLCPDLVPSYAGLADGRGVDERSQFLDILAEESVEEVDVGGLEVDEVLEFFERCRLHGQEAEASLSLDIVALDGWGRKAVCAKGLAHIRGV
jgi:hypothetical protein